MVPLEILLSHDNRPQKDPTVGSTVQVAAAHQNHLNEVHVFAQNQESIAEDGRSKRKRSSQEHFQRRVKDLMIFKAKYGHCNVNVSKSESNKPYLSLGQWCEKVRRSRRLIEEGKPAIRKLSNEQIEVLNALGFQWEVKKSSFDTRIQQLGAFKAKFGHCNVSLSRADSNKPYHSLAQWCCRMRQSRRQIEEGKPAERKLSKAQMERLDALGFS